MDRTTVPPHISRLLRAILPVSLAALALLFVLGGISLAASSARLSNTPIVYDQTIPTSFYRSRPRRWSTSWQA